MHRITIVGVGLRIGDLTFEASDVLTSGARVVLRTGRCALAEWLAKKGVPYRTLDSLYEKADDFDALHEMIVDAVMGDARSADVVYAVPDVRDRAALQIALCAKDVRVVPGVPVDGALWMFAQQPTRALAAADIAAMVPDSDEATLVREIDTRRAASDVKLALMERYPPESPVHVVGPEGLQQSISLCDLDRLDDAAYAHDMAVFVPASTDLVALERYGFTQLNRVVRRLRAPDGCPWDIKQTHESIARNVVEEAYEVVDAIESGDIDALYDELGDLLLQVALHSEIARQCGEFGIDDVTTAICKKLISRHEHIFGNVQADTPEEVLEIWEKAKKREKQLQSVADTMRAVTNGLPQLMRASKVQKKADSVGFGWTDAKDALPKVFEEADELKRAMEQGCGISEEAGDLLFACVNVLRMLDLDSELVLHGATDKFIARFDAMEQLVLKDGKQLADMTIEEKDRYWDEIKRVCVKE